MPGGIEGLQAEGAGRTPRGDQRPGASGERRRSIRREEDAQGVGRIGIVVAGLSGLVLAQRVRFAQVNLNDSLSAVGEFDVIFLRNVLIYFDAPSKQQIVARVVRQLR